jgi:nitrate reductase assembly molybdenum cofactor insertion protein NarJ
MDSPGAPGAEGLSVVEAVPAEIRDLLAEAAAWRLLGLLLERPREGWRREVEDLARECGHPDLAAAVVAAGGEASEGFYLAILGPGGAVSAREVSYRGMEDPGRILADLEAFYEAFAFTPRTEEAPDHLAVEAGFVGYLRLKEAFARAQGEDEKAATAALAASRFLADHASNCAQSFAERIATTEIRYLTLAAQALAQRVGPPHATASSGAGLPVLCDDSCSPDSGEG